MAKVGTTEVVPVPSSKGKARGSRGGRGGRGGKGRGRGRASKVAGRGRGPVAGRVVKVKDGRTEPAPRRSTPDQHPAGCDDLVDKISSAVNPHGPGRHSIVLVSDHDEYDDEGRVDRVREYAVLSQDVTQTDLTRAPGTPEGTSDIDKDAAFSDSEPTPDKGVESAGPEPSRAEFALSPDSAAEVFEEEAPSPGGAVGKDLYLDPVPAEDELSPDPVPAEEAMNQDLSPDPVPTEEIQRTVVMDSTTTAVTTKPKKKRPNSKQRQRMAIASRKAAGIDEKAFLESKLSEMDERLAEMERSSGISSIEYAQYYRHYRKVQMDLDTVHMRKYFGNAH